MAKSVEIPQDIIDNVIAAVGDDTHLLKQCSLVSSSFLLPSRKHLFSRITISSDETCQGIHQFLVQNPVIQSFVRIITLMHMDGFIYPEWMNGISLLAILRLPFCCLECFSINLLRIHCDWNLGEPWGWNCFSSEIKDALSNIILSSTLKTLYLGGITNMPITIFLHIARLTTLELDFLSPSDFCDENSSSLTQAASDGVALMAFHTVIDKCVWRFGEEHARQATDFIFLPFMCRLRFLEIHLYLGSGTRHDFNALSFLMGSLSVSLTAPERLEFNIRFYSINPFNNYTFYENLRIAWTRLDSIATHPTSSQSQRVDININYVFRYERDNGVEPDKNEISKAVIDGLPLLHTKGILFVEVVLGE